MVRRCRGTGEARFEVPALDSSDAMRSLPSINIVMEAGKVTDLQQGPPREAVVAMVRDVLEECRERLKRGEEPLLHGPSEILAEAQARLAASRLMSLRRVINGTGIALHTNLGRAPLAEAAIRAVTDVARSYANLELDLAAGRRGSRYQHVVPLLRSLTDAEDIVVVNNNAAAVLLLVTALADKGEVVVSRGELVEIGGSFRIPDVIRLGGASLVEVGTTNKTRCSDYEAAIGDRTRLLMKVHQSNFRIDGFVEETSVQELADLARGTGIAVVEDLGSGCLMPFSSSPFVGEPTVKDKLNAGADVVTFSGDKLLGGPQAGIIAGRAELIRPIKAHPLLRAVRIDKLSLAALEATLRLYLDPRQLSRVLPIAAMMSECMETLRARGDRLCDSLNEIAAVSASVSPTEGYAGGGALPGKAMPSVIVKIRIGDLDAGEIANRLRLRRMPVIGRISKGCFALDLRTMAEEDLAGVAEAVAEAAS